jgi:Putative beta-lactamase-inhibitor-like, PepSY-like
LEKKAMKRRSILFPLLIAMTGVVKAQDLKSKDVPAVVKSALAKKYPEAAKISWEKEKGNYEANWGGRSGEDNSVTFTPAGNFVEIVKAIPVSGLPLAVAPYVAAHYKGAKIKEAGKVTDAAGKTSYEAEVKGGDLIFDEDGNFVKKD